MCSNRLSRLKNHIFLGLFAYCTHYQIQQAPVDLKFLIQLLYSELAATKKNLWKNYSKYFRAVKKNSEKTIFFVSTYCVRVLLREPKINRRVFVFSSLLVFLLLIVLIVAKYTYIFLHRINASQYCSCCYSTILLLYD